MGYTDDQLLKMVNNHSDITNVLHYVMEYSDGFFNELEAREIAEEIVNKYGYTKDVTNKGEADHIINYFIRRKQMKQNSIKRANEPEIEIPLKSFVGNVKKYWLTYLLAGTLAVGSVSMIFGKDNKEITTEQMLGMIASQNDDDQFDYKYKNSIVEQNIFYPQSYDKNGDRNIAYSIDGIANDILRVCGKDPKLFDLCMASTYFDIDWYRLDTMGDVLNNLKFKTENKEHYQEIYEKIAPYDSYIDYILNSGLVNPTPEMLHAVEVYRRTGYVELPKEEKKEFDKLIDLYREAYKTLEVEYSDDLKGYLGIGDNYGTRKN